MGSNDEREYRSMELTVRPGEEGKPSYRVEGYATTYDPYLLCNINGKDFYERIAPEAFEGADLTDVVFRVEHNGRVYARSSNGSLEIFRDSHGLGFRADLSRTPSARDLFEDIKAGNYPKMSFAFKVFPGGDHFEPETRTRVVDKVAKVFDFSPVAFASNPETELTVSARSWFDGVIEAAQEAERLQALELRRKKLKIKLKNGG